VKDKSENNAESKTGNKTEKSRFTKEQILCAFRFANRKDLLTQILEDGKTYTIEEIEKKINEELGRKVK
jgi:hypothetical protein